MFKAPFSFDGRIRRLEYGLSYLIYLVFALPFNIYLRMSENSYGGPSGTVLVIFFILLIPFLWFMLAQGAKRCHDRGNSGWFQLIPFYGLWMLFADSENGPNEYGPNPKGQGNYNSINEIGKKEA
ncbi:DUF805 domain-containing protein [Chryseobacterium sp. SN22]|uniref:DUF805 domain-containing protein n=1 Tax=Chryseobacterium sp. SN22 TaxID=2606431 RepID=UPI0011EF2357|nr:DUF805 domain-containing protein [Chryseobacterium sp. SN22]KAA0130385.1 DUF805 domain-containing protein [Chryseobacterium sp. SN22]